MHFDAVVNKCRSKVKLRFSFYMILRDGSAVSASAKGYNDGSIRGVPRETGALFDFQDS